MKHLIHRQKGLTLTELMIAMVVGLFLISGALTMFLTSKKAYTTNQSLSSLQESGRYAMTMLNRDIRNAGYKGICLTYPLNHDSTNITDSIWVHQDTFIKGWMDDKPSFLSNSIRSNTDSLFIQYAGTGTFFPGDVSNVISENEITFGQGSFTPKSQSSVLISDGIGCDLFTAAEVTNNYISKDSTTSWSHDYSESFELLSMHRILYYIADDNNVPTLYKAEFKDDLTVISNEAMVPGISSLKFTYGIFSGNAISSYVTADNVTDWDKVAAVKVALEASDNGDKSKNFESIISFRNKLR